MCNRNISKYNCKYSVCQYRSERCKRYITIELRSHGPMGIYIITKVGPSIPRCTIHAWHVPRKAMNFELKNTQWLQGLRKVNTRENVELSFFFIY